MHNVCFEVGGIGTGQIVNKHLFFGWQYIDNLNGLEPIGMKELHAGDPEIYRMVINGLPQFIQQEVIDASRLDPEPEVVEVKPLPKPTMVPKKEPVLTDEHVRAVCKEWYKKPNNCTEFDQFLFDIQNHSDSLLETRRYHMHGPFNGWAADILGQCMINARNATNLSKD